MILTESNKTIQNVKRIILLIPLDFFGFAYLKMIEEGSFGLEALLWLQEEFDKFFS